MYHRLLLVRALDPFSLFLTVVIISFDADSIHIFVTVPSVKCVAFAWRDELDAIVHCDPRHSKTAHFVVFEVEAIALARAATIACVRWLVLDHCCYCPCGLLDNCRVLLRCHSVANVAILAETQIVDAKDRFV